MYYASNMGSLGQELALATTGLTALMQAAPSIESALGIGGSSNAVDPAGAQRQQAFQAAEAATAQQQAAQQAAVLQAPKSAVNWSMWTNILVFGGVGLVVLGVGGLLAYRYMHSGDEQ